ncbi:hypothetical protein ANCDUO_24109 [Ancylostoma duodenale]|uniref:Uncharacterized protein n=1 Tax=Ancylostoma duodenale TaxID=51022 RepID=A0A0C2FBC2_9BILA|nr:hypothetical protein ANCDUO_24109 [Ancylostoma duodenale]
MSYICRLYFQEDFRWGYRIRCDQRRSDQPFPTVWRGRTGPSEVRSSHWPLKGLRFCRIRNRRRMQGSACCS